MKTSILASLALLALCAGAYAQPYQLNERTLLLDHFDHTFTPDGKQATSPAVMREPGKAGGAVPMQGAEFVPGVFGQALQMHGEMAMAYPGGKNINLTAGAAEFRVALNFDAEEMSKAPPSNLRNQLYFTVFGPQRCRVVIYSTLKHTCLGVWDGHRQLVLYGSFPGAWKAGEWHHLELRWGRQLELWCDGERKVHKEWDGLFGPLDVKAEDTTLHFGSHLRYSDVVSEFRIDEFRVLGPGGEQTPSYPMMSIPKIKPPVIDGRIDEAEWSGAARTTGFVALKANELVADQTAIWAGWDDESLYVAGECSDPQRRPIVAMLRDRDSKVYTEDAVDIILQPVPNVYPYYQLIANAAGTRYDSRLDASAGVKSDTSFNPDWTVKTSVSGGQWRFEAKIPFAELDGRPTPKDGERWRANFCRDADAATRLSSWAFADANFHRYTNYGEIIFRDDDRAMRLDALGDWAMGRLDARLALTGLAFDPLVTVRSRLMDPNARMVAESENRLADYKQVTLALPSLVTGLYTLTVTAATEQDEVYFHRIPFRVMKAYDIQAEAYPYEGKLWIRANVSGLGDAAAGVVARSRLVSGKKTLATCKITEFTRGVGEGVFDITAVPPGKYMVVSEAVSREGKLLVATEADFTQFSKPAWWRSTAGIDHTVPAPWTPVEAVADKVSVWGREYVGAGAIPDRIINQGAEMLAGPIRFTLSAAGAHAILNNVPARVTVAHPDAVTRSAQTTVGGVGVALTGTTEFDGMHRCDITLTPAETACISSLVLEIPVKTQYARMMLSSNGRSSSARMIGEEPWESPFMPQVWLGNDDMGLAWFAESDQYWQPRDAQMIQVVPSPQVTTLRCAIIRKPLVLKSPATITFGLMATPVKQVPTADPFWFRFGGAIGPLDRLEDPAASRAFMEFLRYPGEGNFDPRQGTLEFRLSAAGMNGGVQRQVARITGERGSIALDWTHATKQTMRLTVSNAGRTETVDASGMAVPTNDFSHVALTWGSETRLYVDGRLFGSVLLGLPADMPTENAEIRFGCASDWKGYSWMAVDEVRVSGVDRYRGQTCVVPAGPFTLDEATLLLDHLDGAFVPDGEDAETRAEVISGHSGELGGVPSIGCEVAPGAFGHGMRIVVKRPPSSAQALKAWGCNAMLWWAWFEDTVDPKHGWPPPLFIEPLRGDPRPALARLTELGIRTCPYMAYTGMGAPSDLSRQFGAEWARRPLSTIPAEPPKGHHFLDCCGRSGWADYLAAGTQWLLDDLGFYGCYTDGNGHAYPCNNTHHGCGYVDGSGTLQATWPIFGTREYLKRMYRLIRARHADGYLVNHVSYNTLIPTMSFTDVYYSGEHEQYEDLTKFRVRWQSKPWGIWPILLGADAHAYRSLHMTYSLLHGVSVWPHGSIGRNDMMRKTVNLWQTYDRFGYRDAEWVPYYRAEAELAAADDEDVKVSGYVRAGERTLLVAGNLAHEVVECKVKVRSERMGLEQITARNALSGRPLAVNGDEISVRLRPTSFMLVWVE